jgi:hypothetical protein
MDEQEIRRLWAGMLSGHAVTKEEKDILLRALEHEAALRKELLSDEAMDGSLRALGRSREDEDGFVSQVLDRLAAERDDAEAFVKKVRGNLGKLPPARPARVRRGMWISVAACLAIIVGALVYNARQEERFVEVIVARIQETSPGVQVFREADGKTVVAVVGMDLFAGDRIETRKGESVIFGYPNERTTITAGNEKRATELRIGETKEGKRLHLEKGFLDASVAPQPEDKHMIVTTPHAKAEVVGTKFKLWDNGKATWIEVTEGEVLLERLSDGKALSVPAGRLAVAGEGYALRLYDAGAEYVAGPVIRKDDFESGLKDWELYHGRVALDEAGHVARAGMLERFSPDEEARFLRIIRAKRNGRMTRVLVVEIPHTWPSDWVILHPLHPHAEGLYTERDAHIGDQWQYGEQITTIRRDAEGNSAVVTRHFVNGGLVRTTEKPGTPGAQGTLAVFAVPVRIGEGQVNLVMDNVVIRRMVRVER